MKSTYFEYIIYKILSLNKRLRPEKLLQLKN